jgi:hypothetical protein
MPEQRNLYILESRIRRRLKRRKGCEESMKASISIGSQSFEKIKTTKSFYVDKT